MPMLKDPSQKYLPYPAVPFPEGYVRQWPTRRATSAPTWLSTDLRDGNQALANPMSNATKLELFRLLVKIGFKEIEVAYPAASENECEFVRSLIANNEVPDDVSLQIITPARLDLIPRSVECLAGCKTAIIHLYNAVSPVFREVVFRNSPEQTIELTCNAVRLVKKLTEEITAKTGTHYRLNYCLETFSQTEPKFAVELGNRVLEAWGKAGPGKDMVIFNLPATVEVGPSNHYADMVEYFGNHINQREFVTLSVHPHNDRGTAVAAAEQGVLAGGTRIEGCLLGNGERTGNVDLITLALNLYSQGVAPELDFSDLPAIAEKVSKFNDMPVPARYPYAGQLVFSAFAGTHQDAIKKGLDKQKQRWEAVDAGKASGIKNWAVPYIPLDPKDLGYGYENLIRVSSQSGKAGASYIVKQALDLDLPRRMQVAFYKVVQDESDRSGREMTVELITTAFKKRYGLGRSPSTKGRLHLRSFETFPHSPPPSSDSESGASSPESAEAPSHAGSLALLDSDSSYVRFEAELEVDGHCRRIQGDGRSPALGLLNALDICLDIKLDVHEVASHVIPSPEGSAAKQAAFIEVASPGSTPSKSGAATTWGVGVSSSLVAAQCRALVSAACTSVGDRTLPKARLFFKPRLDASSRQNSSSAITLRAGHRGAEVRSAHKPSLSVGGESA